MHTYRFIRGLECHGYKELKQVIDTHDAAG